MDKKEKFKELFEQAEKEGMYEDYMFVAITGIPLSKEKRDKYEILKTMYLELVEEGKTLKELLTPSGKRRAE